MSPSLLYLAIDVGTGSVRTGVFDGKGFKLCYAEQKIKTRNAQPNHYEQSSENIWQSTVACIRSVVQEIESKHAAGEYRIAAVGIDATCSLVACKDDSTFTPLSVISSDDGGQQHRPGDDDEDIYNIILWLDRRGIKEAGDINLSLSADVKEVRSHFGDTISPENEPPKLLWLSRYKKDFIENGIFFDLADWLAFKMSGDMHSRSSCTIACKWGWGSNAGDTGVWNKNFWKELGLEVLTGNNFRKIGNNIVKPGNLLGTLSPEAAATLGLPGDCVIAAPLIDAHAGSLWTVGVDGEVFQQRAPKIEQRLSLICGTSTCFIALSRKTLFVEGIWGPFRDAVVPGFQVTEGGQSVTGKLLENIVERHPSYAKLCERVGCSGVYKQLEDLTETVLDKTGIDPTQYVHCLDYHAGNRSPLGDPSLKGCFVGLTLSDDEWDLAVKYRATLQALCYGARHIVEEMKNGGLEITIATACGGICKSDLFLQELADALCLPVVLSSEEDTVLLGGAILAKAASSKSGSCTTDDDHLCAVSQEMSRMGRVVLPNQTRKGFHDMKYAVYRKMHADYISYVNIMNGVDTAISNQSVQKPTIT